MNKVWNDLTFQILWACKFQSHRDSPQLHFLLRYFDKHLWKFFDWQDTQLCQYRYEHANWHPIEKERTNRTFHPRHFHSRTNYIQRCNEASRLMEFSIQSHTWKWRKLSEKYMEKSCPLIIWQKFNKKLSKGLGWLSAYSTWLRAGWLIAQVGGGGGRTKISLRKKSR